MPPASPTTLIEAVQTTVRRLHYSPRTEEAYLHWIRVFIAFHEGRHPRKLGGPDITAFLNHLAVQRHTAASTQNQALCAVLFLYRCVLNLPMPELHGLERARRPEHLPAVLSRREVIALLDQLEPRYRLMAEILYGSGLRLLECLALRVKDVDLDRHVITVRRGKGNHDRAALLPSRVRDGLRAQLDAVAGPRQDVHCCGRAGLPKSSAAYCRLARWARRARSTYSPDGRPHRRPDTDARSRRGAADLDPDARCKA